ncbi:MAG: riboflavin synthase [Nitrosomonadales bacterium]|jgi:riboflavin synthase|nr:MAG: riboflavin synthase subunit alpha [Methylophilales bacterium BACL14 MAG-120910-bin43]KRP08090.1 MAG: riboflavin synthase subunit alpha [Methylophilales bacterium BACL14 MAG-120920-bin58]MBT6392235.1 riboflavin synthase [Nitrosomonadales bacterium]|tara:strand:+ start:11684 stop:12268 length:585 start_codon:yes stop_codon:yes gene_type:complete
MFTGIIESEGTISSLVKKGADTSINILFDQATLDDIKPGDSIAVNGVCLTVEAITNNELSFYLSVESISKIADLKLNQKVNLERSLKINERISGHFVFGHVDGVCTITEIAELDGCQRWLLKAPKELIKYIAKKGSVSLSGVSLTVNSVSDYVFSINLIPFTLSHTTLKYNKAGDKLNIEIDMLARYVESINKK